MMCGGLAGAEPPPLALEGTVSLVRSVADGGLELELCCGTNRARVEVKRAGENSPALSSRIRAERREVSGWGEIQVLTGSLLPVARNTASLREVGRGGLRARCVADLEGEVLAVSPNGAFLAFKDGAGVTLLEMQPPARVPAPGQKIHIEGNCTVEEGRAIFRNLPLVDNDDVHEMKKESGSIYLTAGRHPLRVDWFNRDAPYGLQVYYQGPDLPRQRIPDSALFRKERDPATGRWRWVNGLDYRCYEGSWMRTPAFPALVAAKRGMAANFDTSLATRINDVGLEFEGYLEAPRQGIYTFWTISDDGSLLFLDETAPVIEVRGSGALPKPVPIALEQSWRQGQEPGWSQVEGTVTFASEQSGEVELELGSDTGRMRVELADGTGAPLDLLPGRRIRATGLCLATRTVEGQMVAGTLLAPGINQIEFWEPEAERWSDHPTPPLGDPTGQSGEASNNLPLLTKVEQIKRLTREQWQRGYPVKIRGVVTTVLNGGFFIQDPTWSVYARWQDPAQSEMRVGDYWEVQGKTFAEFAPNIQVSRAVRLGFAALPEPLRPAWDRLINGSLDTEYVEVQGIVTAVSAGGVSLLTRSGTIGLELPDLQPQALPQYDNALIRVRGCVIPIRDIHSDPQRVEPGRIRLCNASITVDEAAPKDPFATPLKHAADLLLFDSRAGAFQRVKIAGQILHERAGVYFLADGKYGLRFIPKTPMDLAPGDLAEAVGFLELDRSLPVLREAAARRVGRAKLPEPRMLGPEALLSQHHDATLVKVRARLTEIGRDPSDDVLRMQLGTRAFIARLQRRDGPMPALSPGSLLELTGVYAGQGGDLASGREFMSFELLLNGPSDIQVLARPSWWTIRHTLTVVGGMAIMILAASVWISLLHRQVEERSQQLTAETRRREYTEQQRAVERERSRIAKDLHDDLGGCLTEIKLLAGGVASGPLTPSATRENARLIAQKSDRVVRVLDEIVWAVDSKNDSVASLADYLSGTAEEFLRAAGIVLRLDIQRNLPVIPLSSECRHELFVAVREALNNVARHSGATAVWLRFKLESGWLSIVVEDNGHGFNAPAPPANGNGLGNLRERLARRGGSCRIESSTGAGTRVTLALPTGERSPPASSIHPIG